MIKKINARTLTLISLIAAMICAVLAGLAFLNLFNSKSENNETASAAGGTPIPEYSDSSGLVVNLVEYSWEDDVDDTYIQIYTYFWGNTSPTIRVHLDNNYQYYTSSGDSAVCSVSAGSTYVTITLKPNIAVGSYRLCYIEPLSSSGFPWIATGTTSAPTNGNQYVECAIKLVIVKKPSDLTLTADSSVVYGSTLSMSASGTGTISWSVTAGTGTATLSATTGTAVTLTPTKVGTVTVKVTTVATDIMQAGSKSLTITIKRKGVTIPTLSKGSGVASSASVSGQTATTTYNGSAQHFTISSTTNITFGTPTSGATRSGSDFYATTAKTYTVTMSLPNTTNYCWGADGGTTTASKTLTLTINKATYDMSGAKWNYSSAFTYDGSSKTVSVSGLPSGVSVNTYSGNSATNAGSYTASVTFNYDSTNYNAPSLSNLSWVINKATYDMSGAKWNYTSAFTYDGSSKTVVVTGLPGGVSANYSGNTATSAGSYTASVTFNYDSTNYNAPSSLANCNWVINKATYNMSSVKWDYTSAFTYDGSQKTVSVINLPSGVSASYSGTRNATNAGGYTASVTFSYDTSNYNAPAALSDCVWVINQATPTVTANVVNGTYVTGNPLSTVGIDWTAKLGTADVAGTLDWDDPTALIEFNDGTASVTYGWTFTPSDTTNFKSVTGSLGVIAMGLDEICADGQKTAYKAYESFTADGMTVYAITYTSSGDVKRAVTGYTYSVDYGEGRTSFRVSDSGCEVTITYTEGSTTKTFSFTVTVDKADYDLTGVTFDNSTVTYDGQSHKIECSGLPAGVSVERYVSNGVEFTGATNAGTYVISAVISIDDTDNMNLPDLGTATLEIEKATANIDTSGMTSKYTYTGKEQTVSGGATADSGQEVKYANNTFTTVAEGNALEVDVYVEESTNYNEYHVTFNITVDKATATIDVSGVKTVYSYTGSEQSVDSGATVDNDEQTIVYSNNKFTTVAEGDGLVVTISVAASDNYKEASATVTITVNKATLSGSITFDDLTVTYDGKVHTIEASGFGDDVTVTYYYTGTKNVFEGETNVKYDGGAVAGYSVTAHFECTSDNYEFSSADSEKTATLTIKPREITASDVSGIDATYEYTGNAQTPKPEISIYLSSEDSEKTTLGAGDYKVTYSTSDADAGTVVTVTIDFYQGNYYSSNPIDKTFTITKKVLGIKWSDETGFTYNGQGQGLTAEFTGLVAKDIGNIAPTITYSGTTYAASGSKPVDAGTYTATVTLDTIYTNYEQFVGVNKSFTIKKATPSADVKFTDYDPSTDKLYPDNKLPDIDLDGTVTAGTMTVDGHVEWRLLDDGSQPYLVLDENVYVWVFIPDDIVNFETVTGEVKLTAVMATLSSLFVSWKDTDGDGVGNVPDVYTSTDLETIRTYITVTGTLENGDPYGEISRYDLSGSWGPGDKPLNDGTYTLTVLYNGKDGSLTVDYLAVLLEKLEITTPAKTAYSAFDGFDRTTVIVTAVYNDGNEVTLDSGDYTVEYRDGHTCLWAGDTYVTVSYTDGEVTKTRTVTGLSVSRIYYDLSGALFEDITVNYDGTAKTVTLTGLGEEVQISYVYKQNGLSIAGASSATNAGEYAVVATLTLQGDENLNNYYCNANGEINETLEAKLTINKVDYAGLSSIVFIDMDADYNYGASVVDGISVKNLPAGVTASFTYFDKDNNPVDPAQVVNAGEYFVTVTFGVDLNHNDIQPMTVKFTVNKLDPVVTPQVSGNLVKGMHLYQLICEISDGDTPGTIVWNNDETVLEEGINRCYYTFVPDDSANFNTVSAFIDLNASATAEAPAGVGSGLQGWEIALIIICIVLTVAVCLIAIFAVSRKKGAYEDVDGFNDYLTEEDLKNF